MTDWRDARGVLKGNGNNERAEVTIARLRGREEVSEPSDQMMRDCDDCYTPQGQILRTCTFHEGWIYGYVERDAEVERLRAALREYADPDNWERDDWGVVAIFSPDYGTPGQTAVAALTEGGES